MTRSSGPSRRRWQFGICLFAALSTSLWVAAEPKWEVRELTQQSPARVNLQGAWFAMGSDAAEVQRALALCEPGACTKDQFSAEMPARRVYVRSFEIDRLEVSNAAYARCVSAGRCLPPRPDRPMRPTQPVTQVSWREARDYCHFAGGELPSEAQWEYAARGDSQRSFPWGDAITAELASYAGAALQDVSAFPKAKSFFGLLNLAGNVAELTLDRYVAPYSSDAHSVDPVERGEAGERVLRGGSYRSPAYALRARARAAIGEQEARADVGFRCAYRAGRDGP
jgi:formylglycine-generating enzyme